MRRFYVFGFIALLVFDTLAQLCMQQAAAHADPLALSVDWVLRVLGQPWIYCALAGYVGAFAVWMSLLQHAPIGPAFAASHLDIVSVMLMSVWLLGERVGPTQIVGALCIVAGIVCLAFSETGATDPQATR